MGQASAAVLRAARALIDTPDKWCKGAYNDGGRRCASGAVNAAWNGVRLDRPGESNISDLRAAREALRDAFGAPLSALDSAEVAIVRANDRYWTTHRDVMQAFDRAIALLEARREGV